MPERNPRNRIERAVLKRAGGMQGRLFVSDTVFIPENIVRHREVSAPEVQDLFPTDSRVRHNRFTGDLYIKSYRKVKGQTLVRWSHPVDLEAGIRSAGHVKDAYDPKVGVEVERTRNVIVLIKNLSASLQVPEITPLDMRIMAERAAVTLTQSGFVDAVKDTKLDIAGMIMRAASLDSRSRINPSMSRMVLSHAWVDLIHELLIEKMTENKYASIQAKLIREREFERFVLSQTVDHIDQQTRESSSFEDKRNVVELKQFMKKYLSADVVKLKPYSRVAAISRFLVMNTGTNDEHAHLKRFIGSDADIYYGLKPMTDPSLTRRQRLGRLVGVRDIISEQLEIGELFINTETAKREEALKEYLGTHKVS